MDLHEYLKTNFPWAFRERARNEFGEGEKELKEYMDRLDDLQPFERTTSYPWEPK